jgi:GAF domain-containing protein
MVDSEAALDLGAAAAAVPAMARCLSVPLLDGEALIGVLTLYGDRPFDEEHGRLVQTVAPHIAESLKLALSRAAAPSTGLIPSAADAGSADSRRRSLRVVSRR